MDGVGGGVTVHRAGADELRTPAELRCSWRTDEAHDADVPREAFVQHLSARLTARRESHLGYLALVDGEPVATSSSSSRGSRAQRANCAAPATSRVLVERDRRGAGVGGALMRHVVDEARTLGLDYLLLHPTPRSLAFYRRLGFRGDGHLLELRLDAGD